MNFPTNLDVEGKIRANGTIDALNTKIFTDTGTENAMEVTISGIVNGQNGITISDYAQLTGIPIHVAKGMGLSANGTLTLNVNAMGAKDCFRYIPKSGILTSSFSANSIASGQVVRMIYDGSRFVVQNVFAPAVVDGLDSTSAEDALSAKQGGVLNASITQAGNNIASLGLRVDNLESLGHYLGTYDTVTAMPNNSSSFTITPTINDFVNIRQDENYANAMTRYVIEAIAGDGTITWSYDITYSTDVTGKADQSALDATNSQLAQMAASLSLIGNPTWYPMVLQNGATTVAGTAIEARYCKIGRVVFFSGIIISDSGAVASVLPSGFRPKGWEEFTVPISTYSGNSGSRSMRIIDNGSLYLNAPVSPSTVHNYFNIACSYVAEN